MNPKRCTIALALAFTLSACAGQQKQSAPPTTEKLPNKENKENKDKVQEVDPQLLKKTTSKFDALSKKQRAEFMKTVIVPKMEKVFQEFDSEHFAKVNCVTCHGPGAKDDKFEMPTPSLPKLDFSSTDPKLKKWNTFMKTKVVPTMAAALGEKPYDPATKQGFGCLNCHMKKAK